MDDLRSPVSHRFDAGGNCRMLQKFPLFQPAVKPDGSHFGVRCTVVPFSKRFFPGINLL